MPTNRVRFAAISALIVSTLPVLAALLTLEGRSSR